MVTKNIKKKTNTMAIARQEVQHTIQLSGLSLEQVKRFKYLGVIINSQGSMEDEINKRIAATGRLYNAIKTNFLGKKEMSSEAKADIVKKVVKSS